MIVKDEEKHLDRFLKRINHHVDEIVIVDTGSKDSTKKIARKYTDKVFDFSWDDDFSAARNFSISKATERWILVLDPDEQIDEEDLARLKSMLRPENLGYRIIQKSYHKGKLISVRGICRIFQNNKKIAFVYPVHETVRESIRKLGAQVARTGIIIRNFPNLSEQKCTYYLKLLKEKKKLYPQSNVDKEIELETNYINITK